ncbi:uncharacterized protein LOC116303560 [Actinia tenebrosa]|uniref:Uncharacterized protein LOC116303560 n=1 Tax=Actinia tenebrosa TaxID=6105 RepID=A0A6P8IQ17_ACTTE|nr:uncharacterized protein LOC116303560 [Actinia tenebrosa]
MDDAHDESDLDLDEEPMLDDFTIILALLATAIVVFYILYSNWPASSQSSSKQEPSNFEEDNNSRSEVDKPEDLLFDDSDDENATDLDLEFPAEEYEEYLERIDNGLRSMKKSKEDSIHEQEKLHAATENEELSNLDMLKRGKAEESVIETHLGDISEDVCPMKHGSAHDKREGEIPSNFDQDTVLLSDSCVEITAAGVLEGEVEEKTCIDASENLPEEEGAIPVARESLHAEGGDAVTSTVPNTDSVEVKTESRSEESEEDVILDKDYEENEAAATSTDEVTITGIISVESKEDVVPMEKNNINLDEEYEKSEAVVTSTDEVAVTEMSSDEMTSTDEVAVTEMSSDESKEDVVPMERNNPDEGYGESEATVTLTEGTVTQISPDESREDVIPMAKDNLDEEHAVGDYPDYVRVSGSVMERKTSQNSPEDADSTSDINKVMIGGSSIEVTPCEASTLKSNEGPSEDQTSEASKKGEENCANDQIQNSDRETSAVENAQEEHDEQDLTSQLALEEVMSEEWNPVRVKFSSLTGH